MRTETLLFVIDREQEKILLAMKKVRFGAGKYNGTGGRVEEHETIEQAAVREAREEIGVRVEEKDLQKCAIINFSFEGKPNWSREVHVFTSGRWSGEPQESEEMAPEWFGLADIPYEKMWIDDRYWMPLVLAGKNLQAAFHFTGDGSEIMQQEIHER